MLRRLEYPKKCMRHIRNQNTGCPDDLAYQAVVHRVCGDCFPVHLADHPGASQLAPGTSDRKPVGGKAVVRVQQERLFRERVVYDDSTGAPFPIQRLVPAASVQEDNQHFQENAGHQQLFQDAH